jgi:hypothetical protein
MQKVTKSYATTRGHAYYKHTGRYNEVKKEAQNSMNNDAPSATKQKNLAPKGQNSAASQTLSAVVEELGW